MIEPPLVEIVVEWAAGDTQRHEWDEASGVLRLVAQTDRIMPPEHYGCVPGALAAADGELLDVVLLRDALSQPGTRLPVRLIGVLRRSDGDSKLVAVDPAVSALRDIHEVDARRLAALWRWFIRQHVILGWSGPDVAWAILEDARRCWALAHVEEP